MLAAALLTAPRTWKPPKCPATEEQIRQTRCVHTHAHTHTPHTVEHRSAINKNEIVPFAATRGYLEIIILREGSQRQIHAITCVWDLKV